MDVLSDALTFVVVPRRDLFKCACCAGESQERIKPEFGIELVANMGGTAEIKSDMHVAWGMV
eukprot:1962974-Amphidinium_carterae.1